MYRNIRTRLYMLPSTCSKWLNTRSLYLGKKHHVHQFRFPLKSCSSFSVVISLVTFFIIWRHSIWAVCHIYTILYIQLMSIYISSQLHICLSNTVTRKVFKYFGPMDGIGDVFILPRVYATFRNIITMLTNSKSYVHRNHHLGGTCFHHKNMYQFLEDDNGKLYLFCVFFTSNPCFPSLVFHWQQETLF